ncbi:hypothetical protein KGM_212307 [Danaus plexippus plexippus]|uniref:Uncharacterized protein n=1 Tax=Danaus plexippus plexippus TaxID=278856 RepID=A0A212EYP0_DANPL|nr:hypothetical protein KGM_212307 [Danaus plexippus plexippus]
MGHNYPADSEDNIRQSASENIKVQQIKYVVSFNSRRKTERTYKVGDLVRIERQVPHDGKSKKLVEFQGPYRVIKLFPNERYVVEDTPMTRKNKRRYEAVIAIDKMQQWLTFSRDLDSGDDEDDYNTGNELEE